MSIVVCQGISSNVSAKRKKRKKIILSQQGSVLGQFK